MYSKTRVAVLSLALLLSGVRSVAEQAPFEEKGFRPEKMYSFGSLDHVNTFNGNLVVSIPVGMRYPLDGGLTYGLSLTYNSKVWDFDDLEGYQLSSPGRRANAGMGWLLTMGRLVDPNDPSNPMDGGWVYESPDGADHPFAPDSLYATSVECSGPDCGMVSYTRDGSFLRMRVLSATLRTVESGDGSTSEFELVSGKWRLKRIHGAFRDNAGNPLSYVNVTYPGPAGIAHCPGANSVWQLNDSEGRTHFACFKDQNVGVYATPTVDRVVLTGFGEYATYFFEYDLNQRIPQSCQDTYPDDPSAPLPTFDVPYLRRVKLPDGANGACSANDCSRFELGYAVTGCPTGALKGITLPTKGRISYTYDPKEIQANAPCPRVPASNPVGVSTRTLSDAAGNGIGTWTYAVQNVNKGFVNYLSHDPCSPGPIGGGTETHPVIRDEAIGTVLDPAGNKFVQHYSVWPGNPGHPQFNETSPDGFRENDYSLPIGKFDAALQVNLSREVLTGCDSGGSNCAQTLRKSYVRYRLDPSDKPADAAHQTIVAERTVYLDDVPVGSTARYAHVDYSDYDGFGHYRKSVTSGTFEGNNVRTTHTTFNNLAVDAQGRSASGQFIISKNDPWILGTYDAVTVTDETGSSTSAHCFDATTGWLRAVRIGEQNSVRDLVTLFTPETNGGSSTGNVASERFYGGDGAPLTSSAATQPICTIANGGNPGPIGYRVNHTYSSGQRATSRYEGMPFFVLDRDIDPSGLTLRARATDGLVTTYGYDRGGRLLSVQPPGQAATSYVYTNATVSGSDFAPARVKATTSSAAAGNVEVEYQFDALGRFWREKTKMPNDTWSVRELLYDALDRKTSVSEPVTLTGSSEFTFTPQPRTVFSDYDAFGRARTVTAPDNSKTTFTFKGVSETTRTARIATGQPVDTEAKTTETYDQHGRLLRVRESGPGGAIETAYGYDVGNRLSAVSMGAQSRTFDYDGRGLLRWESHPESGMTSYTYDAKGHVLSKSQGAAKSLFDLAYQYDVAERLVEIRGRNPFFNPASPGDPDQPELRLMKKFVYGTSNEGTDRRLGKLWTASRYNYDPDDPFGATYKVSETYVYGDAGGRKTKRLTNITRGSGADESGWQLYRTVTTEVAYNDLSLPEIIKYPYCVDCGTWPSPGPVREQGYGYTKGRLASVSGFLNAMSYWPNGMWNTLSRSNGMTDTQELDPSKMARPASISAGPSTECAVPAITGDPVGGTVTASNPVTLSVSVSGTGPFTYEWWGTELVGTGPTFTATLANTPVTTEYRVLVTNACKTVASVYATVSVGECLPPGASVTVEPNANTMQTLVAEGAGTEPRSYTWRRASDPAILGTGRKLTVGPLSATTTYTLTVGNNCAGSPFTKNVIVTVPSPMTAVLTAARTPGANQIKVTWTGPATGVSYVLQRRSGAEWTNHIELSAAALAARTFTDAVDSGRTYAYRLKDANDAVSNADVATTTTFPPAVPGARVTASSFVTVLSSVNSVRAAAGWPAVAWANILSAKDPLPVPGAVILSVHIASARARMNEALQVLGVAAGPYAPGQVKGVRIEAAHLNAIVSRAD